MQDGEGVGLDSVVDRQRAPALYAGALDLRTLRPADAGFYAVLYTDAEVMRHVGPPLTDDAASRAFARVLAQTGASPPRAHYWIVHGAAGVPCGLVALVRDPGVPASAELGMMLVPAARRRGHAIDSILRIAAHAFAALGIERLWTRHHRDNVQATALMQAVRFRPEPGIEGDAQRRWVLERGVDTPRDSGAGDFAISGGGR